MCDPPSRKVYSLLPPPPLTSPDLAALGVVPALLQGPAANQFCLSYARFMQDRIKRKSWNVTRTRDIVPTATCNEVMAAAAIADREAGERLGILECGYMQAAATVQVCECLAEHLAVTGGDGVASARGYDASAHEFLCESYLRRGGEALDMCKRARGAMETARYEGEVEREREAWEAERGKVSKKKGKKKGKAAEFRPRPPEEYLGADEVRLKLLFDAAGMLSAARLYCHRGTFRFYEACKAAGAVRETEYAYTTPEVVFDRTYAKLLEVPVPVRPAYADYIAGSVASPQAGAYTPADLLDGAEECYGVALKVLEQLNLALDEKFKASFEGLMGLEEARGKMREAKKTVVMNKLEMVKARGLLGGVAGEGEERRVVIDRRPEADGLGVVKIGDVVKRKDII
ncbi:hypothetical protein TeGR_g6883 [Tetraparma gracilis]|uniref:Uncharacterized protein n=1 Tax=Tetraparma gracilis TaxID=2962635 RepID=A0ABQ6MAV1_9STRA|nr:hypothetical protein TeGR_g6883 [Tetraparma gracilis]